MCGRHTIFGVIFSIWDSASFNYVKMVALWYWRTLPQSWGWRCRSRSQWFLSSLALTVSRAPRPTCSPCASSHWGAFHGHPCQCLWRHRGRTVSQTCSSLARRPSSCEPYHRCGPVTLCVRMRIRWEALTCRASLVAANMWQTEHWCWASNSPLAACKAARTFTNMIFIYLSFSFFFSSS